MNSLRQRLVREDGFTLAELLVVVAIIGVLLAVAIPTYIGFTNKAEQTSGAANTKMASIETAGNVALAP